MHARDLSHCVSLVYLQICKAEVAMSVVLEHPICEIVVAHPETIPVFERIGIEYCCQGTHTLRQACKRRNLDSTEVLAAIDVQNPGHSDRSWQDESLSDLCRHITQRHHEYTRRQLLLIRKLLDKVQRRHGTNHPEVFFIGELLSAAEAELLHHFHCEEDVLFLYITRLEEDPCSLPPVMFQDISQPLRRMIAEHTHTDDQLNLLREKTNNYQPPADACTTFRALWKALEDLEKDIHLHIHLENDILFPRAQALTEQYI